MGNGISGSGVRNDILKMRHIEKSCGVGGTEGEAEALVPSDHGADSLEISADIT
jgi:hypothetical protein